MFKIKAFSLSMAASAAMPQALAARRLDIQPPFRRNLCFAVMMPCDRTIRDRLHFIDAHPMTRPPVYYGDYLQIDRLLSLQVPESAQARAAGARRDAVHHRPPGLRALVQAGAARVRPHRAGLFDQSGRRRSDGAHRALARARPRDPQAAGRPARRAGDHDAGRFPRFSRLPFPGVRLSVAPVPADRDAARPARGHARPVRRRGGRDAPFGRRPREARGGAGCAPPSWRCSTPGSRARRSSIGAASRFAWPIAPRWCGTSRADVETIKADAAIPAERRERRRADSTRRSRRSRRSSSRTRARTPGDFRRRRCRRRSSSPSTAKCRQCSSRSACSRCSWTSTRPSRSGATVMP